MPEKNDLVHSSYDPVRAVAKDPVEGSIDIDRLVSEISSPSDLDEVVREFDKGETWLRDLSLLGEKSRSRILYIYDHPQEKVSAADRILYSKVANNLRDGMSSHLHLLQEHAGWNFLVNAQGFINADIDWAQALDGCFVDTYGKTIHELLSDMRAGKYDINNAHKLVAEVAGNAKYHRTVGVYMAGRSRLSEQFQEIQYAPLLREAKTLARKQLGKLAVSTGLSGEYQERALRQIERAKFSAFDHLLKGVTVKDNNVLADYASNTLRIEVKFGGSPAAIEKPKRPNHSIQHELNHTASAQAEDGRCGLSGPSNYGVSVNEGMTEFLAQEALQTPDMTFNEDGSFSVGNTAFYARELAVMTSIYIHNPHVFAVLYKAYYGQIDELAELRHALKVFYNKFI